MTISFSSEEQLKVGDYRGATVKMDRGFADSKADQFHWTWASFWKLLNLERGQSSTITQKVSTGFHPDGGQSGVSFCNHLYQICHWQRRLPNGRRISIAHRDGCILKPNVRDRLKWIHSVHSPSKTPLYTATRAAIFNPEDKPDCQAK